MITSRYLLLPLVVLTLVLASARSLRGQTESRPALDSVAYARLLDSCFAAGNLGDYARAESFLAEALHLGVPKALRPMLLNNLGGLQLLQGKDSLALASFTGALGLDPHEETTRFNRAKLFVRQGNYKAALTDFALLLADHPRHELYLYQRAMVYLLTKEYELAEGDLKTIIEHNGGSLKARIGYALLETMRGRYDDAERLYAFLLDKLPTNIEVLEGRARMYLAKGMKGFAQRDIDRAFELAKSQAPASLYRLRAELQASLGNTKAADEDLRQADRIDRIPQAR